jgi:hypothetical protein
MIGFSDIKSKFLVGIDGIRKYKSLIWIRLKTLK